MDGWQEILERLDFEGWRSFYEARHKKKAARWRCDVTFFKVVRGGKTSDNPVQVQELGGGAVVTVSPCE